MKLRLTQAEADELVRVINEDEPIDESLMQSIKAKLLAEDDRPTVHVRREDLEDLINMVPLDWHDIHQLTNPNCSERTTKRGKVKPCLTCKLSQKREKALRRLRESLGMPLGAVR